MTGENRIELVSERWKGGKDVIDLHMHLLVREKLSAVSAKLFFITFCLALVISTICLCFYHRQDKK